MTLVFRKTYGVFYSLLLLYCATLDLDELYDSSDVENRQNNTLPNQQQSRSHNNKPML